MRQFTDTTGREWSVDVNVHTVKQVRLATGTILPNLFGDGMKNVGEFVTDYETVATALWAICEGQHEGVDAEQFAGSLGGDALASATEALVRATADFASSAAQRDSLHQAIDSMLEASEKMTRLARNEVAKTLANLDTDQLAADCLAMLTHGKLTPATQEPTLN